MATAPNFDGVWGTAPGLLALLTESNPQFQIHGLNALHQIIENEWPQIADNLQLIEELAANPNFIDRENAALLASKTYYHLGKLKKAVHYAILADSTFDSSSNDEFTRTVIAQTMKQYIRILNDLDYANRIGEDFKTKLSKIVDGILHNLILQKNYTQCLCLSIETRFDVYVKLSLQHQPSLVTQAIALAVNTVSDSKYRQSLLKTFVDFASDNCDKFQLSQLHHALRDPLRVAELLITLKNSSDSDNWLLAYQIAFELAENASQKFRQDVITNLNLEFRENETKEAIVKNLENILQRKILLDLYLQFLFKNNKTDIHIIVALKETLDNTKMLVHSSVIAAYSFMFAGTGDDNFYRNNTAWFSNGRKWAQFITIAAVGAIHIGHLKAALQVLQPFLSRGTPQYALGGGLYALGLIYANYSWEQKVLDIVLHAMENTSSFVIKHGGCLALGLIAMGSQNLKYYEHARGILMDESPEAGEAAGYAIGMIMLGCGPCQQLDELYTTASTSVHEKVTRGGAMGLALMMYGKEEQSETLIQNLLNCRIPLMRESAAWVTALAYVGTASNTALQRLLHLAVSDVNPDVRRAAVIGVGFVLSRSAKEVPSMVDLLAKSYHPHVRSGAALALGIACAGTGMQEAIAILEPLLEDLEDFVKQSAMIAMAMVLQQQSDTAVPYAKTFRKYLMKMINKKRNDLQVFGLCLAYGVLNAGGRNVVISCNSLRGENSVLATVGLALFCNYFYWQPLALMLPLAFHPTAVIGLDKNLQLPNWPILSKGNRKLYANPPSFESEKEVVTLQKAAQLSITKRFDGLRKKDAEEVESETADENQEPEEDEQDFDILDNPSRVTINQLKGINLKFCNDYRPITGEVFHGFVMLKEIDKQDDEEEEDDE
ncbi:Proteasome/cyclosome repeat family protein [Tritrichomonas foetus]|uniref:Proteasome/cyclosome repeat family protein n=1 Tax=Tritrichomonas foetus TaxID=1144522 RepID=A0A1J4JH09_9EUKA|nr:Proteasome/cyclosome repeat family protein [Tritrichomonas foetus]|eukprot:OHS97551.1 Proteasome/cyclosome repeat family protein [Tritrichomonas foetus]